MLTTAPAPAPASTEVSPAGLAATHLPLVSHIVREFLGRVPSHVSRDELTSAGLLALVQAERSFDPERGASFAGFAAPRVRGALLDELRGIDWASRSVRRRARDLDQTRTQLVGVLGRTPSEHEVAAAAGVSVEELRRNAEDVDRAKVTSLHATEDHALESVLPHGGPTPEQVIEHRERLAYMRAAVTVLPARLRTVIEDYFLAERPMSEIAEELGVTESRVSQMRAEALVLMRGAMGRALEEEAATAPAAGCAARRRESYYADVAAAHHAGPRLVATAYDATA